MGWDRVIGAALLAALLAGCGSSGLASESANQVLQKSLKAGAAAASVNVAGVVPVQGRPASLTVRIARGGSEGTVSLDGVRFQFVLLNGVMYVLAVNQPITARIGSIQGHPLLDFTPFPNLGRTLKIYNVFAGDSEIELQCQYTAEERSAGVAACHQMLATLRFITPPR